MKTTTRLEAIQPSPDCCLGWLTVREALTWQPLRDHPGVWTLPSLGYKSIRFCPCCGATRTGVVWNMPAEAQN